MLTDQTQTAHLATGGRLAYVPAGAGGYPLLLLHGYPATKRIWWRNIGPLAEVGLGVIAPDLRGYGDSGFVLGHQVIPPRFPDKCKVAFTERVGPFVVPGAGHSLQWEQATILNRALTWFFADLRRCG